MRSERPRLATTSYILSILWTILILLGPPSLGQSPGESLNTSRTELRSESASCTSVLLSQRSEFARQEVLLEFLKEDPGAELASRFTSKDFAPPIDSILKYYSGPVGHAKINSIVWEKNYRSPNAFRIGELVNAIATGAKYEMRTFAGTTLSKNDFNRLQAGSGYSPGYFFSTTKSLDVAKAFLKTTQGRHHPQTHLKVFFEVIGRSGRDISSLSEYNEFEVLYPPDSEFKVVEVKKLIRDAGGFEVFRVLLKENTTAFTEKHLLHEISKTSDRDLLRMQSRKSYAREVSLGNQDTLSIYPLATQAAYKKAVKFVHLQASKNAKLSVDLLKEIHRIALEGHFFEGYYRRRIRREFLEGKISEPEALNQLLNIETKRDLVNQSLPGSFRSEDIDNFVMTGLNIDPSGHRYFQAEDLYRIATNPYFRIEADSILENPEQPERVDAKVLFLPVGKIASAVQTAFNEAHHDLALARSDYDYVMSVLKLQKKLISIHPFHDGNGRAIKLLSDFLYLKRFIAPPLHANNDDYTLSIHELYRQTVQEMKAYLNK